MKKHHVKALASAFATANGHDDPTAYADKVADAYVEPKAPADDEGEPSTNADLKATVAGAKKARQAETEEDG